MMRESLTASLFTFNWAVQLLPMDPVYPTACEWQMNVHHNPGNLFNFIKENRIVCLGSPIAFFGIYLCC